MVMFPVLVISFSAAVGLGTHVPSDMPGRVPAVAKPHAIPPPFRPCTGTALSIALRHYRSHSTARIIQRTRICVVGTRVSRPPSLYDGHTKGYYGSTSGDIHGMATWNLNEFCHPPSLDDMRGAMED